MTYVTDYETLIAFQLASVSFRAGDGQMSSGMRTNGEAAEIVLDWVTARDAKLQREVELLRACVDNIAHLMHPQRMSEALGHPVGARIFPDDSTKAYLVERAKLVRAELAEAALTRPQPNSPTQNKNRESRE